MDTQRVNTRKTPWQIFATPTLIALLSLVGLLAALLGNGVFDWVSWVGLAAPVVIVGWAMKARRRSARSDGPRLNGAGSSTGSVRAPGSPPAPERRITRP